MTLARSRSQLHITGCPTSGGHSPSSVRPFGLALRCRLRQRIHGSDRPAHRE